MDPRLSKLINAFENNGWVNEGTVDISNDWWFKDILQLRYSHSRLDKFIYLTLLTDPQFIREKKVWCIGISTTIPGNENFRYLKQVTLNDIKRTNLNLLAKEITRTLL